MVSSEAKVDPREFTPAGLLRYGARQHGCEVGVASSAASSRGGEVSSVGILQTSSHLLTGCASLPAMARLLNQIPAVACMLDGRAHEKWRITTKPFCSTKARTSRRTQWRRLWKSYFR